MFGNCVQRVLKETLGVRVMGGLLEYGVNDSTRLTIFTLIGLFILKIQLTPPPFYFMKKKIKLSQIFYY